MKTLASGIEIDPLLFKEALLIRKAEDTLLGLFAQGQSIIFLLRLLLNQMKYKAISIKMIMTLLIDRMEKEL